MRASSRTVLWVCDPMHGNTEVTARGVKTRRFHNILGELEESFDVHTGIGSSMGGVQVELSGSNVTECIGGARGLTETDLDFEDDPDLSWRDPIGQALGQPDTKLDLGVQMPQLLHAGIHHQWNDDLALPAGETPVTAELWFLQADRGHAHRRTDLGVPRGEYHA